MPLRCRDIRKYASAGFGFHHVELIPHIAVGNEITGTLVRTGGAGYAFAVIDVGKVVKHMDGVMLTGLFT